MRVIRPFSSYSAVTFICSKTDDISITEATESLDIGEEMVDIDSKIIDVTLKKRNLTKDLKEAAGSKEDHEAALEQLDEEVDLWENLQEKLEGGQTVYAPVKANKRKRGCSDSPNKRQRCALDSSDDEVRSIPEQTESPEAVESELLTAEAIDQKLDEFKRSKKDARREKHSLGDRMKKLRKELDKLDDELEVLEAQRAPSALLGGTSTRAVPFNKTSLLVSRSSTKRTR